MKIELNKIYIILLSPRRSRLFPKNNFSLSKKNSSTVNQRYPHHFPISDANEMKISWNRS